jgi:hypothetical protein
MMGSDELILVVNKLILRIIWNLVSTDHQALILITMHWLPFHLFEIFI